VVEWQYAFATRKLVDSDAEQLVLEELVEGSKRAVPEGGPRLHFLLSTPFRYPPLRHGSRFGTRQEGGIWYGSREQRTAFAEAAYYRLLFLDGTGADLGPLETDLSAFRAPYAAARGVDLTRTPFAAHREALSSPSDYAAAQALGTDMRAEGVEAARYHSARDAEGGVNVALFSPAAFAARRPSPPETWRCLVTRGGVDVVKKDVFRRLAFRFERAQFEVGGRLPAPAL
jgi:hypothetical protein